MQFSSTAKQSAQARPFAHDDLAFPVFRASKWPKLLIWINIRTGMPLQVPYKRLRNKYYRIIFGNG